MKKRTHFQETGAGIVPCAVLLVGLSIIPESPRWLVRALMKDPFFLNIILESLHGGIDSGKTRETEGV